MSDASDQETKINKPQRILLVILLALTPIFVSQAAFSQTKEEYNAQIAIAKAEVVAAQDALKQAQVALTAAQELQADTLEAVILADSVVKDKASTLLQKQQAVDVAQAAVDVAQANYNNNLISDPDWVIPTEQVRHVRLIPQTTTRIETQTIPNILFNSNFSQGTNGWSGVSAGWQGSSPALLNDQVTFSFQTQSVVQGLFSGPFQNATLVLSADWHNNESNRGITDTYSMKVEVKDINQNPVGTAIYNSTESHDWQNKSVTLQPTGPVSYITVTFTGIDNGFWYGVYGPSFKNPSLSISHGQEITETTFIEEVYYTTEIVVTQVTLNVDIGEGGEATFTAPPGATFTGSSLRYESYSNPSCGADVFPQVNGLQSVTLSADNGVFGDPCGGEVKHLVGTLAYTAQPVAPLIKNPVLKALLDESTVIYNSAAIDYGSAQADLATAEASLKTLQDQQSQNAVTIDIAQQNVTTTEQAVVDAQSKLEAIPPFKDPTPTPEKTTEPIEEPEKPITPEIPEPVTPTPTELPFNIETVNPQELSAEQVTELISVANEILNNSEQGSTEYEQALEALFVAAEADDLTVNEDLAAIPLLGNAAVALTDAVNFLGNVGSDMSPKVREESEKIVVTAVVAVGAAVNAATGAALGAAAPSAGGSPAGGAASNNTNTRRNK